MKTSTTLAAFTAACALLGSCASSRKIEQIRSSAKTASLALPAMSEEKVQQIRQTKVEDLLVSDEEGRQMHIMNAVRDEATGEMVATEQLRAAVLVARFRNVAERLGMVDMEFLIVVSDSLQDPRWQLRFDPVMYVQDDTLRLEPVLITGEDFRRSQIRGYGRYDRFLRGLSRDSTLFVDHDQAGKFLDRTSELSREEVEDHYSRRGLKWLNARKVSRKEELRRRYIKVPIEPEYARLDSVWSGSHPFIYMYSYRMPTRPGLRKVTVSMDGAIYEQDRLICELPPSEPVTFYISSLSSLADTTVRRDSVYQWGVKLLLDKEYKQALAILTPYRDYNTAVAYLALDYNATAAEILENLPSSAPVDYMLALSYSRRGRETDAVEHLLKAVAAEPSYKYRGNLDPEIAAIIRKYSLFAQD
jgi:outer membrane murein-binding lipoprotein Lpp